MKVHCIKCGQVIGEVNEWYYAESEKWKCDDCKIGFWIDSIETQTDITEDER